RYLLCEVNVSDRSSLLLLDDRAVAAAVKAAVGRAHGDYGAAACSVRFCVKYLNAHTGIVFLRFPKKFYRLLWSALPFITAIETRGHKIPCFLNCLHVGGKANLNSHTHTRCIYLPAALEVCVIPGTIRTCQKFLIQYNKQQLHRMLPKCKNKGK
ncbi:unnamed protein product, partial [Tetraodon nigroviridis]